MNTEELPELPPRFRWAKASETDLYLEAQGTEWCGINREWEPLGYVTTDKEGLYVAFWKHGGFEVGPYVDSYEQGAALLLSLALLGEIDFAFMEEEK